MHCSPLTFVVINFRIDKMNPVIMASGTKIELNGSIQFTSASDIKFHVQLVIDFLKRAKYSGLEYHYAKRVMVCKCLIYSRKQGLPLSS